VALLYVAGFAALAGSFYAFEAILQALVIAPMCSRACGDHAGLQRVDLTHHGKATHCVCLCGDGTGIRSEAGETVSGLQPLLMMLLACVIAAVVAWVMNRRARQRRQAKLP
jgi:hypothetical protein